MEVSCSPWSSVKIASPLYKLSRKSSNNLTTKPSLIAFTPYSIGFGRSHFINISAKHDYKLNFTRACSRVESDSTMRKRRGSGFGDACWRLIKPYTIMGTVLVFLSLFARALMGNPNLIEWSLLIKALFGIVVVVCGNCYTCAINQIYDVEIDKINKPDYPIAAGDLSVEAAWILVIMFAATGLSMVGLSCGMFVTSLYAVSLILGTAYSVPPLRLKESPLGTILSIPLHMGIIKNISVYYATRASVGLPFEWSAPLVFIIMFTSVMAGVMAFVKDLSDVDGDTKFGIRTLASIVGVRKTAYLGFGVLVLNYGAAIIAAVYYMPLGLKGSLTVPVHFILACSLIYQMWVLEQAKYTKEASERFYMFIWNLYYAEYMLLPFI